MLLKIPTRSLNEEITTELFSTEIDDQNQMKKITNQVDQIMLNKSSWSYCVEHTKLGRQS